MEQIARYAFNFTFNQISSYLCKCLDLWIFLLIFQHVLFGLVKQTLLVFVMCISGGQILRRFCFSCKYSTYFTVYIYIYIYIWLSVSTCPSWRMKSPLQTSAHSTEIYSPTLNFSEKEYCLSLLQFCFNSLWCNTTWFY